MKMIVVLQLSGGGTVVCHGGDARAICGWVAPKFRSDRSCCAARASPRPPGTPSMFVRNEAALRNLNVLGFASLAALMIASTVLLEPRFASFSK